MRRVLRRAAIFLRSCFATSQKNCGGGWQGSALHPLDKLKRMAGYILHPLDKLKGMAGYILHPLDKLKGMAGYILHPLIAGSLVWNNDGGRIYFK